MAIIPLKRCFCDRFNVIYKCKSAIIIIENNAPVIGINEVMKIELVKEKWKNS